MFSSNDFIDIKDKSNVKLLDIDEFELELKNNYANYLKIKKKTPFEKKLIVALFYTS